MLAETTLQDFRNQLPEYAKDVKLNLGQVLSTSDTHELTEQQLAGIALACAYATRQTTIIKLIENHTAETLDDAARQASKVAASIMAMNNVYYRFVHLVEDPEFLKMPAGLRMNSMANPGVDKKDFELYAMAVSAINGCGMCLTAHAKALADHQVSKAAIQHAVKIAAVLQSAAQVADIENS